VSIGDNSKPGFYYVETQEGLYEYYYIYKWSSTKCFRFRMGHKIGNIQTNTPGSWIQVVFVLQPYKSYTGI
jgi:hypothetical protein